MGNANIVAWVVGIAFMLGTGIALLVIRFEARCVDRAVTVETIDAPLCGIKRWDRNSSELDLEMQRNAELIREAAAVIAVLDEKVRHLDQVAVAIRSANGAPLKTTVRADPSNPGWPANVISLQVNRRRPHNSCPAESSIAP